MCRNYDTADLTALASGDLSPLAAWRLRRHLAACAECRAEHAAIVSCWQQATQIDRTATLPPDLADRTWTRIAAVSPPPAPERPLLSRRRTLGALSLTAAGALAAAAAMTLLPGSPGSPTVAFARVEQAMLGLATVSWRETSTTRSASLNGKGNRKWWEVATRTNTSIIWARTNFPAMARTTEFAGKDRLFQQIWVDGGMYHIFPQPTGRQYSFVAGNTLQVDLGNQDRKNLMRDQIRAAILFLPLTADETQTPQPMQRGPVHIYPGTWSSHKDTLAGRSVLRFEKTTRFEVVRPKDLGPFPWQFVTTKEELKVWVEPDTYRVVRREIRRWDNGPAKHTPSLYVSDQFRYNAVPPPGIFDPRPPGGTRYSFVPLPKRQATSDEKAHIAKVVREALSAWNRKDAAAYRTTWDFDYSLQDPERRRENEQRQLRLMAQGVPARTWRNIRLANAPSSRESGIFVHPSDLAPFPPKEAKEFIVMALADGVKADGRIRPSAIHLNMRKEGDDFRITYLTAHDMSGQKWDPHAEQQNFRPLKIQTPPPWPPSDTAPRPAGRP